jgi:hypothetical protein
LIRRGFSYGPAFEGSADDGVDRGLVGLFFCARLNEQLYTILRWLQATEFSDVFAAQGLSERCQDAVLGNRMRKGANTSLRLAQLGGVELSASIATFVRFKGVVPLFVPSLRALAILAGG